MKNEDVATTTIEYQTRKIPSVAFLGTALCAMGASAALILMGRKQWANFVGQWVPTILIMGVYNKIAKTFSPPVDELERMKHGDVYGGVGAGLGIGQQPVTHS